MSTYFCYRILGRQRGLTAARTARQRSVDLRHLHETEELLAPVAHRHVVLTIPRLLRPLFRRRRDMLTELARAGAEATVEIVRRAAGDGVRPGLVVSLATAGDLLQWHPHLHLLTTDGGFAPDGSFFPLPEWDATLLMSLFRERLLARLLDRHAISHELVRKSWGVPAETGSDLTACRPERGAVRPQSDPRRQHHSSARCQTVPADGRQGREGLAPL